MISEKYIVMFSSGITSWYAARRLVDGGVSPKDLLLLFADTKIEDEDNYRFLQDAANNIGSRLEIIADGRTPWETFKDSRFIGNSRVDVCSRILKREVISRWLKEHARPDFNVLVYGLSWEEEHRIVRVAERWRPWECLFPLNQEPFVSKKQVFEKAKELGLKRPRLYDLGFDHANCLSGDTRFITDEGIKTLKETVGQTVSVLGVKGGWKDAIISSFGTQKLWNIRVSRYGCEKTIRATEEHRWFKRYRRTDRVEVFTRDLRPGDMLASMYSALQPNVRPSAYGIAHGIVFGDGSRSKPKPTLNPARVLLCGHKDRNLLKWFPLSPAQEVPGKGTEVRDLPRIWKDPPDLHESKSYLLGWLSGYFATDGTFSSGQAKISSAIKENLELVCDVAVRLGIGTSEIRSHMRNGFRDYPTPLYSVSLYSMSLTSEFFLIPEHRAAFESTARHRRADWKVVSVEQTEVCEEVFCATVPDGHAFTLDGNILTGNCGGFCVKAGKSHFTKLLQVMPERYAHHEERERV